MLGTRSGHGGTKVEPWLFEYNTLARQQEEVETALEYLYHATVLPAGSQTLENTADADDQKNAYSQTQRHQQHHHELLSTARQELSAVWRHNVRLTRTAMQNCLLALSGYPIEPPYSPFIIGSSRGLETAKRARENYDRVLATLRSTLYSERQFLVGEERALDAAVESESRALLRRAEERRAGSSKHSATASSSPAPLDNQRVVRALSPRRATQARQPRDSSDGAEKEEEKYADHYRALADQVNAEYYAFLAQHGGLCLEWPEDLHDRFLRVALRVQRASSSGTTSTSPRANAPPSLYSEMPPAADLRDAAVEAFASIVEPSEVERHVELYLRYHALVHRRKQAVASYQVAKQTIAMQRQQLVTWRQQCESQRLVEEDRAERRRREERQAVLKERVAEWRASKEAVAKQLEAEAEAEAARAEAKRRATAAASRPETACRRGGVSSRSEPSATAATAESAADRLERQRQRRDLSIALRARRERDMAIAKQRHAQQSARQSYEEQSTKLAIADRTLQRFHKSGTAVVLRPSAVTESRYWDPTASSLQHRGPNADGDGDGGALTSTGNPSRDAFLNAATRERWAANAHLRTVLYKPQTTAPSWCGRNYQL